MKERNRAGSALNLAIAGGACLTQSKLSTAQADAVLSYTDDADVQRDRNSTTSLAANVFQARLAFYRRTGNRFTEMLRQTSLSYAMLAPALSPTYVFAGTYGIGGGLLRESKKRVGVAGAPDIESLVKTALANPGPLNKASVQMLNDVVDTFNNVEPKPG